MANLKEVRNRIVSVTSTQQITKAMKMVSAAKLRKATEAIVRMRPYSSKLTEILSNVSASLAGDIESPFGQERDVSRVLFVAITSNRGLCGGFNSNVVKAIRKRIADDYYDLHTKNKVDIICIGKKGYDLLNKDYNVTQEYNNVYNDLNFNNVAEVAVSIMDKFESGHFDKVVLVYNQVKNAAVQFLTEEQFLPLASNEEDEGSKSNNDYIFEPSKEFIVQEMIPKALKTQLYKAILDSVASEHGARMTAMDKATENASELLGDLKLQYNKARQAAITTEILEIVGGAEALKG
ncbi:ATP synthase F1 subunit gamma [bacterium AH-315-C07]|nr:ATP synthase F1 subunit gamma [bacterium AH-315-C07]